MDHRGVPRHRQAVGSFRSIFIVRPDPLGDPEEQVHRLIHGDLVSARHVLIHFEGEEAQAAYALFDALDRFVMDKKNKRHASKMPLGIIKVTKDTLHVIRNYVTGRACPVIPIVCIRPSIDTPIGANVRRLVHGDGTSPSAASNRYILLFASLGDRDEAAHIEEFVARLTHEVLKVSKECNACTFENHPLGLLVYTHDTLSCWENYVHAVLSHA